MEKHVSLLSAQESLRKITHTLALKNEEISNFVSTLKQNLDNLEVIGDACNATPCRLALSRMLSPATDLLFLPGCLRFSWRQANSSRVQEDLEAEFMSLHAALDEMKESMMTRIKQEKASRTYELQVAADICIS